MARKINPRRAIAGGCAALLVGVGLATVLPAGAAEPSAVRLHLATDGDYFAYGADQQSLTTPKNTCAINSPESIIDLESAPAPASAPGIVDDGLGVKTSKSSSNGTPCSQVEASSAEALTISAKNGGKLGTRRFVGVSLDLELTGNAFAKLDFTPAAGGPVVTYTLQTGPGIDQAQREEPGYDLSAPYDVTTDTNLPHDADRTDACAAPNSSGPNSGINDNCRWTVYPGFEFRTFTLRTTTGTVSLEGGGDFGGTAARETLLHLANTAPTAVADSFPNALEDTPLTGNVLTNDTDPQGDPLDAVKVTDPAHGTLALDPDGSFTYQPALNYNGPDSFTYKASDGGEESNTVTVSITVRPVNDPPVAVNDLGQVSAVTDEDTRANDVRIATDVDSTRLVSTCSSVPPGAVFEDNFDGTVDITPPANFFGELDVTCTVVDNAVPPASATGSARLLVGVTSVNDVPVADDDVADVDQDVSASTDTSVDIDVLDGDADVETATSSLLIVEIVVPQADLDLGASATVVDGKVRYSPPEGFVGTTSFTYKVSDGQATSAAATVTVEVVEVMCSGDTESTKPLGAPVSGTFTRLSDFESCKRYRLEASQSDGNVLFQPSGDGDPVKYRGFVTLGPDPAPVVGGPGEHGLLLRYDKDGDLGAGPGPEPVPWCVNVVLDSEGVVTSATLPGGGHTWCIVSESTKSVGSGPQLVTMWQVYGEDDPRFTR